MLNSVGRLSGFINVIAGIAITFIMFLTVLDVILRSFRRPIVGTYELVAFSGAVVVGFAIPLTSWMRGHIYVDFFTGKLPKTARIRFQRDHPLHGDRPVFPHRVEPDQGGHGPAAIRGSVADPAAAVLPRRLRRGRFLLRSVPRSARGHGEDLQGGL
ncbi:MAG: TRAP transporter small permease [Desulfosudis oleivorans]|nr:TRAP transporter small permease [Desulfosudis oleivorans]